MHRHLKFWTALIAFLFVSETLGAQEIGVEALEAVGIATKPCESTVSDAVVCEMKNLSDVEIESIFDNVGNNIILGQYLFIREGKTLTVIGREPDKREFICCDIQSLLDYRTVRESIPIAVARFFYLQSLVII